MHNNKPQQFKKQVQHQENQIQQQNHIQQRNVRQQQNQMKQKQNQRPQQPPPLTNPPEQSLYTPGDIQTQIYPSLKINDLIQENTSGFDPNSLNRDTSGKRRRRRKKKGNSDGNIELSGLPDQPLFDNWQMTM